jgi:hypothetical protein
MSDVFTYHSMLRHSMSKRPVNAETSYIPNHVTIDFRLPTPALLWVRK